MSDPFIINALAAGLGIALLSGPLGCFIAWQHLVYFGDAIAHAALLGVVLALLWNLDPSLGMVAVALALTFAVIHLQKGNRLAFDTLLGVAAHGALALGLVLLALFKTGTLDVNGLLFGDVLAIGQGDILLIYGLAALVILALAWAWRDLMRLVLHADIAQVEGVPAARLRLVLMLLIALAVAAGIKVVGILLVTSMLIIPAAAARYFVRTPTQMAVVATLLGMASVATGLYGSLALDTPSGPTIILAGLGVFVFAVVLSAAKNLCKDLSATPQDDKSTTTGT